MRSTIVDGQANSASTKGQSSGSRRCANPAMTRFAVRPFAGRLSHESTVKGGAPALQAVLPDAHLLARTHPSDFS